MAQSEWNISPMEPLFQYLAAKSGFVVDQIRYIVLMLLSFPMAMVLRHALHPNHTSQSVRHIYSLSVGVLMGLVCFNLQQMLLLFFIIAVAYLLLVFLPPTHTQRYSMVWALSTMTATHFYRLYTDYGGYTLDFSGPLMVLVQKVTLVAYALHDGKARLQSELNRDQQKQKIESCPGVLEYFSYMFNFHSFLAGPSCTFREYQSFIDGSNLRCPKPGSTEKHTSEPSTLYPVLSNIAFSFLSVFLFVTLSGYVSSDTVLDPQHSQPFRLLLNYVNSFRIRTRYYFIWLLAEGINNCAGLGFSGYDEEGKAKWDLVSNVQVRKIELATNIRLIASSWNAMTALWLRRCVYERTTHFPTIVTFFLSAWWHGFYPGYYFCFLFFGVTTEASRKMRRLFRHHFQGNSTLKVVYEILTWLVTHIFLDFGAVPLDLMFASRSITYWRYYYFIPAILACVVALFFPSGKSQRSRESTNDIKTGGSRDKTQTVTASKKED